MVACSEVLVLKLVVVVQVEAEVGEHGVHGGLLGGGEGGSAVVGVNIAAAHGIPGDQAARLGKAEETP